MGTEKDYYPSLSEAPKEVKKEYNDYIDNLEKEFSNVFHANTKQK